MGTVSTMLLLTLAAGEPPAVGVPLTSDELQIAVAALEEQRSRLLSFEVTYRLRQELMPGAKSSATPPSDGEFTVEWSWRLGRAHHLTTHEEYRAEWWYDGDKTYVWHFTREETPTVARVWKFYWLQEHATDHHVALVTGFGRRYSDGGVPALVNKALRDQTLSGESTERGWELALGTHDINTVPYDIVAVVDPQHGYRLVSWQIINPVSVIQRFIVDEFQSVTDEADGSAMWYPSRAHMEQRDQVTRLEIDSIRINLDLPDSEFTPPEMAFGTEVNEVMKPGQMAKTYLVGGEDAEEQRLKELAEMARRELDRQEREGVAVDASPDTASNPLPWIISGALLLMLAGFLYWRRPRAV